MEDKISLYKKELIDIAKQKGLAHEVTIICSQKLDMLICEEHLNKRQKSLEDDLFDCLKNNELYLEYQPKVCIQTKRIKSFEVLVRWNHPNHGIISPNVFIPMAEKTRFIFEIEKWVLETVCTLLKRHPIAPISINVSPRSILEKEFFNDVQRILSNTNVNGQLIELEITERTSIEEIEQVKKVFGAVKQTGMKISLDDFGTGYSSLTSLAELEIDTIKIDKIFIHRMTTNKTNAMIIKNLISLANDLEINVVAEGVETFEQLKMLEEYNCNQIQGFLFSKPVPEEQLNDMLIKKLFH